MMTDSNKNQHAKELGKLGAASQWANHRPLTESERKAARQAEAQKWYSERKKEGK